MLPSLRFLSNIRRILDRQNCQIFVEGGTEFGECFGRGIWFDVSLWIFVGLKTTFGAQIWTGVRSSKSKQAHQLWKAENRKFNMEEDLHAMKWTRDLIVKYSSKSKNCQILDEGGTEFGNLFGTKYWTTVWPNFLVWRVITDFDGLKKELEAQIWRDVRVTQSKHAHQLWKSENR